MALTSMLLTAGCVPGNVLSCDNPEVKTSIAEDAIGSIAKTIKVAGPHNELSDMARGYALHDTYETSREGDVLSCQGTLRSTVPNKLFPDFPIGYEVVRSGDGHVLYTFDKERYGPAFIGLMMLKAMSQGGAGNGSSAPTAPPADPQAAQPRPLPYAADPNWSQFPK